MKTDPNPGITALSSLGFDSWFSEKYKETAQTDFTPARVCAVHKNHLTVSDGQNQMQAELSGKFLYAETSQLDRPTVGDWVLIQAFDDDSFAVIHDLLPRKSLLKRRDPGKKLDYQLLAANIDYAFIMQSLDTDFNMNRLERYLVVVREGNISPIILFSKSDLIDSDQYADVRTAMERLQDKYQYIPFSNVSGTGLPDIIRELTPARSYCLLGSSGVGKTSLLNSLQQEEIFRVKEVRAGDSKGRHTTTSRQLIILENGAIIIDTPGMRELGLTTTETGLQETFRDIEELAAGCRFSDCRHLSEQGCAVIAAVQEGHVSDGHYQSYMKLRRESDFFSMSYQEKRDRDKKFGKMVKQVMKNNRKK